MAVLTISAAALLVAISLGFYNFIIYPAFMSPLAKVPNAHWSSPFSAFWIQFNRLRFHENRSIHAAHAKFGPVVRLGPDEVSVNCVEGGIRTIYGAGFEKADYYSLFDNYGVPCMFSTLPGKPHSVRKRMISNIYSKSAVQNSRSLAAQSSQIIYGRLLPILAEFAKSGKGIDVLDVWNGTTMDGITAYQFGLAHSSNFLQNPVERRDWLDLYRSRKTYTFWPQELPRFTKFIHSFPLVRLYPTWVDSANQKLEAWVARMCKSTTASIVAGNISKKPEDEPVVLNALLAGYEKEEMSKGASSILSETVFQNRELSVASEMLDHLAAGHETSGITMAYISWHLSQDLALQDALRAELKKLDNPIRFPPPNFDFSMPDSKQLDSLPLLHAILMETLRLNQAIPGSQPRISPFPSSVLGGFEIPGGTRVSASAYSLHKVESAYPNPLKFDHTRWLEAKKGEGSTDRDRYFWAFSSGGKMCIGSNFAMHELKLIVAAVYTNFRTYIVDDDGIEQTDGYTCGPKADKLVLRFEEVEE